MKNAVSSITDPTDINTLSKIVTALHYMTTKMMVWKLVK